MAGLGRGEEVVGRREGGSRSISVRAKDAATHTHTKLLPFSLALVRCQNISCRDCVVFVPLSFPGLDIGLFFFSDFLMFIYHIKMYSVHCLKSIFCLNFLYMLTLPDATITSAVILQWQRGEWLELRLHNVKVLY